MTAIASPYRASETPLMVRERALEQELVHARSMLDALANEEARLERCVRLREARMEELAAVRETIMWFMATEERLSHELEAVRAEIIARGERRKVSPTRGEDADLWPLGIGALFFALMIVAMLVAPYLRGIDTARDAPRGTTSGWGGPLDPGQTWLYVEAPADAAFDVDGRAVRGPKAVAVSALLAHDVRFAGGASVRVRSVPCTTAVVRYAPGAGSPSVERFYNSSTCY